MERKPITADWHLSAKQALADVVRRWGESYYKHCAPNVTELAELIEKGEI